MSNHPSSQDTLLIQVFGGPRLFYGHEEVHLSPNQSALLGMLFGSAEPRLARTAILAHLWPEEPTPRARRRLNQLLYSLRKQVRDPAPFIAKGDELVRLSPPFSSDLDEFESALERRAFLTCAKMVERRFLRMLEGLLTRELEDWIDTRRMDLQRRLRRGAERQWNECEQAGEWEHACEAVEALQTLDPFNEDLLRMEMEARAKMGFAWEAEAVFSDFHELMAEAGGKPWTPSEKTQTLLEEIRRLVADSGDFPSPKSPQTQPEPPLLGRDEEKVHLRNTLRKVPHQPLQGVLLSGEAGIGKTRIIREALGGLRAEGKQVFFGGTAELEKMIPLNPLIEVFSGDQPGQVLRNLEEPWRTVLFGVMPGHYPGEGPIPEAPHIQPGSVPRRLYEAFYQLLLALTTRDPLVLVLEDLQWADETTLSVLEFLIRRWDQGRLQLLISTRSEEIRRNPVLAEFLENLRLDENFLEITLGDLDPDSSDALIQHLSPKTLDSRELSHLRSLAGGNPFFLIELTLEFLAGRIDPAVRPQEILSIPLSIRQVLRRRLSQLSEDAELTLGTLAVFGKPLDVPGLARIGRLPGSKCLAGLDQLHQFRLVEWLGAEVSLRHELIRQTVYQDLGDSRRSLLHERVARYLLRTREKPPPDELAVHFHHSPAKAEAKHYATEAAARAEASGAVAEALHFLRIAREYSEEPTEVTDLLGRMGHLNYLHQSLDEAAPLLELAAQRFRREGREGEALRSEVRHIDSLAQSGALPLGECLEELARVKEEARTEVRWGIFTKALDVEVHLLDSRGDLAAVRSVLREAEEVADLGGPEARCRARAILALNVYFGSPNLGLNAAREAVKISLQTNDNDLQLHALNRLIVVLLYQGRLHQKEGLRAFHLAEQRLERSGDLILRFFVRLNKAVWHLEVGELAQARSAFSSVEPVIRGREARDAHARLLLNQGELALAEFDFQAAEELFRRAEGFLGPSSPEAFGIIINAGLGLTDLHFGRLGEARKREAELPQFPNHWTFDPSVVVSFKVKMFRMRGDLQAAEQLLSKVCADVEHRLVTAWIKLSLERARLLKKNDPSKARRVAASAIKVTSNLSLTERTEQLRRLF